MKALKKFKKNLKILRRRIIKETFTIDRTISFDIDDCRTSKYFCNKIWQASKYILLMAKNNEESKENQQHGDKGKKYLSSLDQWILSRLSWMVETVNSAFAERNFHKAIAAIRQFLHYEFCDLYVVQYSTIFYKIYKKILIIIIIIMYFVS